MLPGLRITPQSTRKPKPLRSYSSSIKTGSCTSSSYASSRFGTEPQSNGLSRRLSSAAVTGCDGTRTPTVLRALQFFDLDRGSRRHTLGMSLPALRMNVYGPGRHFLASLNGCWRPATTLSGKPWVYRSMSLNPAQRMDIGLLSLAPFRSYSVWTPSRDSRSTTKAYLLSVGMMPTLPARMASATSSRRHSSLPSASRVTWRVVSPASAAPPPPFPPFPRLAPAATSRRFRREDFSSSVFVTGLFVTTRDDAGARAVRPGAATGANRAVTRADMSAGTLARRNPRGTRAWMSRSAGFVTTTPGRRLTLSDLPRAS